VSNNPNSSAKSAASIPQDNPKRTLAVGRADDHNAQHIGLAGDTYTILLTGKDTAGETINIPANAPHQFRNASAQPARLLCICSPAGQEEFFAQVGIPVATRTTVPPRLDDKAQAEFKAKAAALAPRYKTEFLPQA
jgi:uncharacterized cupin superfamily protein